MAEAIQDEWLELPHKQKQLSFLENKIESIEIELDEINWLNPSRVSPPSPNHVFEN